MYCVCTCVCADDIVDGMVDKVGACKAQIVLTRRNRNHTSLDVHHQMEPQISDYVSVVHESKLVTMVVVAMVVDL